MKEFTKERTIKMLIEKKEEFQRTLDNSKKKFKEDVNRDYHAMKTHTADMNLASTINNGHRIKTLAKIMVKFDLAMERVNNGTYGICTECEKEIHPDRLLQVPFTEYCITCKKQKELKKTSSYAT